MTDEIKTIKAQPPQFRRTRWYVLLIGAGSLIGAAIGMSGTNTLRACFFISINTVAIAVIAIVFIRIRLRRKRDASSYPRHLDQ
jgi:hypothetical protein